MTKEIKLQGMTLSTDDRQTAIGELALCAGAELHDGTLRPSVINGTTVATLTHNGNVHTLIFVHEGTSYTNYITTYGSNIYWWGASPAQISGITGTVTDISAVGNTLCFVTTTGIHYVLFKSGAYTYLGTQPPFINLQFSLEEVTYSGEAEQALNVAANEMYDLNSQISEGHLHVPIKENYRTQFSDAAYALINRVHDDITNEGHFYAPFFIRYCYRLYDGTSLVRHSSPVLMPVCIGHEDNIRLKGLILESRQQQISASPTEANILRYETIAAKLQYQCLSSSEWNELTTKWADIVASVDVFISQPILRTRQDEQFKFVGQIANDTSIFYDGEFHSFSPSRFASSVIFAYVPEIDNETYHERLFQPDVFFKVASFGHDHTMPSSLTDFPIQGTALAALAAQQRMVDDYRSHHRLLADNTVEGRHSLVYNRRLHVFAAKEQLFQGFSASVMLPYMSSTYNTRIIDIVVRLATDDGEKTVILQDSQVSVTESALQRLPLFYPDSRAYLMIIRLMRGNESVIYSMPMTKMPLLEGAVTTGERTLITSMPATGDSLVTTPNKIYVSEVRNPFFFPLEARQTVGMGTIYGLGVATRAISPGQFGTIDLMAFCSDGIWALTVNRQTGTYSSAHNVSREVCTNPKSICQLDQSVAFATKRGLSRIVEQDAVSVSEKLTGPMQTFYKDPFDVAFIDEFNGNGDFDDNDIVTFLNFSTHPVDTFQKATTLYDYASERLIIVPYVAMSSQPQSHSPKHPAYVLSLRDATWSVILLPPIKTVYNAYPHPYIEHTDGTLIHLDKPFDYQDVNSTSTSAIVISRAFAFADTMQVIQAFQQVHDCNEAYRKPVLFLFGSNDNHAWQLIGKSQRSHASYLPGHPFRYFRFAVYLQLMPSERYSSLILDIKEKYNKL